MEATAAFPFELLPQGIQLECTKYLSKEQQLLFRSVNTLFRDYVDRVLFLLFVPLNMDRIDGKYIGSLGYAERVKLILAHYQKS